MLKPVNLVQLCPCPQPAMPSSTPRPKRGCPTWEFMFRSMRYRDRLNSRASDKYAQVDGRAGQGTWDCGILDGLVRSGPPKMPRRHGHAAFDRRAQQADVKRYILRTARGSQAGASPICQSFEVGLSSPQRIVSPCVALWEDRCRTCMRPRVRAG